MAEPTTLRAPLTEHLQRQTALAVQLGDQMQARAQVTWSVTSALLAALAVAVSIDPDIARRIDGADVGLSAVIACVGLFCALVVSLVAAFPRLLPFTEGAWLKSNFEADLLDLQLISDAHREEAAALLDEVLATEVACFIALQKSAAARSKMLVVSLGCVAVAAGAAGVVMVGLLRAG